MIAPQASDKTRTLPDGYSISRIGANALRLSHAGAPLVAVPLPHESDERETARDGRARVYEALVRAAANRARMVELRSAAIVAARRGQIFRERELAEAACHARESYDVAIANALERYSQ